MPIWRNDHDRYLNHLKSDYWRVHVHEAIKARCLRRHGRICCERCKTEDTPLQKHHLTYDYLFHELDCLDSILWCCEDCHQYLHGRLKGDPAVCPSWRELEERIRRL